MQNFHKKNLKRLTPLLVLAALVVAAAAQAFGAQLRFESPTCDQPNYAIRVAFDVKSRPATITEVRLNGAPLGAALVFKDGKLADRSKPLDPGPYEILLDYAWVSAKTYTVTVYHQQKSPAKPKTSAFSATSPATGGIPEGCLEGFSRSYRVSEEAGLARVNEIGYLTLTAPVAETGEPGFRVFDGSAEIPSHVLDRREAPAPPNAAPADPPTATCKLAVSLNAAPNERKVLVVLKGRPAPLPQQGLALSGENLGKTLRTPHLVLQFHPQSGQILTIEYPREQVRLWNKAGVIHWNPDVFIPGMAWDHSFDWNPPEVFQEWGDYRTNNLLTFLPKGSFFYEKNAYILLRVNEGTPRELDTLLKELRNPLRIF